MDDQLNEKVLMNHVILGNAISYLSVTDLKSCRVVCSTWNAIATPIVSKRGVCCIQNTGKSSKRNLSSFYKVFPKSHPFKFVKFHFSGHLNALRLEKFLNARKFIKELSLSQVLLFDTKGKLIANYNISSLKGFQFEALKIDCLLTHGDNTQFTVPLSSVGTIKNLYLGDCIITFDGRVAPIKLGCAPFDWSVASRQIQILDLNQHVNLTDLKELKLLDDRAPKFLLDVSKCFQLEDLYISAADIIGWNQDIPLKRLHVGRVPLNLSVLPATLEEFHVVRGQEEHFSYNYVDTFPNMKSLRVEDAGLISRCPNLVRLVLLKYFSLDLVPDTVKTIVVEWDWEILGTKILKVDKVIFSHLFLHRGFWEGIDAIIDRLNPHTVVLQHESICSTMDLQCLGGFADLFAIVEKQMEKGRTFILKRVLCCNEYFPKRTKRKEKFCEPFARFPLPAGEYHLCKGGIGTTIQKQEFDKFVNSN